MDFNNFNATSISDAIRNLDNAMETEENWMCVRFPLPRSIPIASSKDLKQTIVIYRHEKPCNDVDTCEECSRMHQRSTEDSTNLIVKASILTSATEIEIGDIVGIYHIMNPNYTPPPLLISSEHEAALDRLTCPICLGKIYTPLIFGCPVKNKMFHVFCSSCWDAWAANKKGDAFRCPCCRTRFHDEKMKNVSRDMMIYREGVPVPCQARERGCKEIMYYKDFFSHYKVCGYRKPPKPCKQ